MVVLSVGNQDIVGHAVPQMLATDADIVLHFCQEPQKVISLDRQDIPRPVILKDFVMPDDDGLTF